jgi:hypothetical protein
MYTDNMKRAFRSLTPPKNFSVSIIDDEFFLTVLAKEKDFMLLNTDDKYLAVEYMIRVKNALEDQGAVVQLVREGGKK